MYARRIAPRLLSSLFLLGVGLALPTQVKAQTVGTAAGVVVDAQGVLQKHIFTDPGGQLVRERAAAAKATLGPRLAAYSKMRKVSLNRLEKAIVDHQGQVTDTMRYLAGLLRVRYVFYYPESNDIVLAGPAEGWLNDPAGRTVGITSGRPVVQLQDLVVALRAFPPGKPGQRVIGCSIDPTPEGLAAMQQFLRATGSQATPADTQYIVNGLRASLGLQTVTINGVSPKTNFARILVEADYRMKLIGIGLETPPVHLVSFVERANPAQVSKNALFRWYFVPDYQCVRVSDDNLAMELVGDGVKLVGEDELVGANGGRQASVSKGNRASQAFVLSFTKKYAELAERSPVYAELRNVVDLSVAAAYIRQQDYYGKAHWTMPVLSNEKSFAVEVQNAPQQVESAVAAIWKGNRLTTPIGGGVHIEAELAVAKHNRLPDEKGKVSKLREETQLHLAEGQWWWD
jgi:hypothetical protein